MKPILSGKTVLVMMSCMASLCMEATAADSDLKPFRQGGEAVFVPSEMPAVVRKWTPKKQAAEPGVKQGEPFEAALVRVFNEDTQWSSEVAVFRFRDGSVRAWKSKSFSLEDRKIMTEMKAKAPTPKQDNRKWETELGDNMAKSLKDGDISKYETQHFIFLFGKTPESAVKDIFQSRDFIQKAGAWFEKVWASYEVDCQATMPYADSKKPKRIVVKLYGTGVPGVGSGWANSAKEMALDPRAMQYGSTVIAHEFCHVIDAYTGGFMVRPSVGPWWETHAENGSFNYSPTHGDALGNMFTHLNHGCQWPESRYSNWAIVMQLWEKKRTRDLVYGIWLVNNRDANGASEEDPLETTVRIGKKTGALPDGWNSLHDEFGEMAARMVTMDYINQGYLADASTSMRRSTMSKTVPAKDLPGCFRSPADKPLYAYGAHWLPVHPVNGEKTMTLWFRGESKDPDAKWEITLVGIGPSSQARYSTRVIALGSKESKVQIDVRPEEDYVLAVSATPMKYRSLTWNQIPEFDYPYLLKAVGGTLDSTPM